jgi:Polyketide cyclase / dehydrase and lipid transport
VRDSVTVHMDASPRAVWDVVSDVTRVGTFSPETFEAKWLGDATEPALGARFRGHVKRNGRGPTYWTTCTVVTCDPGLAFAFTVDVGGRPVNTWRYDLRPSGNGTAVTESFELADNLMNRLYWRALGWARGRTNRNGMLQTLEGIKAVVERDC